MAWWCLAQTSNLKTLGGHVRKAETEYAVPSSLLNVKMALTGAKGKSKAYCASHEDGSCLNVELTIACSGRG